MTIGIDASNFPCSDILLYLIELIGNSIFKNSRTDKVIIWSINETFIRLPDNNIIRMPNHFLIKNIFHRIYWRLFRLTKEAKKNCDVLLLLDGVYIGNFRPFAIIAHDLLPFNKEISDYQLSLFYKIKLRILKVFFTITYNKAAKVICFSQKIQDCIRPCLNKNLNNSVVIENRIISPFLNQQKHFKSTGMPFNLLVISHLLHQGLLNLIFAALRIRQNGFKIILRIVGDYYDPNLIPLLRTLDPKHKFIRLMDRVDDSEVEKHYFYADGVIISPLYDKVGLPLNENDKIGLQDKYFGAIYDSTLMNTCIFFDLTNISDIEEAIIKMIRNNHQRNRYFNIASAQRADLNKLAGEINEVLNNLK
jgi:hypothetical protein